MTTQWIPAGPPGIETTPYPGLSGTADGTAMIVYVETRATQGSVAYPITSSTQMGVGYQAAVANGFRNVWGGEPPVDGDGVRALRCRADDSLVQHFQGIVLLGVFLKITPFQKDAGLEEELFGRVESPLRYYFGKRGDQVIQDNLHAVRKGFDEVFEVPRSVMEATSDEERALGKEGWERKGKDTNAFFI